MAAGTDGSAAGSSSNLCQPPKASADLLSLEQLLVRRAQSGDRDALRRLLEPQCGPLYARVILPRVGDPAAAQDLLKATMVTALEKIGGFRWQGRSIYFWLRRIAINKVVDHHRAGQRRAKMTRALANEPEPSVLPGRVAGPEEQLIAEEERRINRRRMAEAMARINPRYRRAVELRLVEERPREECARQLEVTVSTFDVVLHRALRAMRKAMEGR